MYVRRGEQKVSENEVSYQRLHGKSRIRSAGIERLLFVAGGREMKIFAVMEPYGMAKRAIGSRAADAFDKAILIGFGDALRGILAAYPIAVLK